MHTKERRSQLGVLEGFLGTGSASTRSLYAGWRRFRNRKELTLRRSLVPSLDGGPDLVIPPERGYTVIPAGRVPEADEIAAATRRLVDAGLREAALDGKKKQLVTGLLPETELTADSPFIRFALRREILRCVSDYLGAVPLLSNIDVWVSLPSSEITNSQLYHRDWADLSQVKVFVHGNDVARENGPLVVLDATASESVRKSARYRWRGKRYRIDDERMKSLAGEDGRELLGAAGTVALVDTCRCFHYGSRLSKPGSSRALCVMKFSLPSAFDKPSDPRQRARFRHLATPGMSEIDRLVLGQTP